jgi:hypothetical protein
LPFIEIVVYHQLEEGGRFGFRSQGYEGNKGWNLGRLQVRRVNMMMLIELRWLP